MKAKNKSEKSGKWTKFFLILAGVAFFIVVLVRILPDDSRYLTEIIELSAMSFIVFALISASLARLIDRKIYSDLAKFGIAVFAILWVFIVITIPYSLSPGTELQGAFSFLIPVLFLFFGIPAMGTSYSLTRLHEIGKTASNTVSVRVLTKSTIFYLASLLFGTFVTLLSWLF